MGAAKKKKAGGIQNSRQASERGGPNWPLLALALIGVMLTGYLTITAWGGQSVAGCPAGSGCDVVLASRWATLFGQPTSFWGLLSYLGLAGIAWMKRRDLRWKLAWIVSLFGALFSVYLTTMSITALEATCPYCLTSAALMIAILGLVVYQRPTGLPKFAWGTWITKTAVPSFLLVLALHLYYAGTWGKAAEAEDPKLQALAVHLADSNAQFFGAVWCPHCEDQKRIFGASAHRLPYIECSPYGRSGPQAARCQEMGIRVYPTWIISGRRYEGLLSQGELAARSGFTEAAPSR
ncbi:MAG: vitamin K epoxide reductase family protein [Candidatus Methylomirabilales bacterium]